MSVMRSVGVKMTKDPDLEKIEKNLRVRRSFTRDIVSQIEEAQEEEKIADWIPSQCAAEICAILKEYLFEINDSANRSSLRMRCRGVLDRYSELENVRIKCDRENSVGRSLTIELFHPDYEMPFQFKLEYHY